MKVADREEAIQSLAKADHPAAREAMIEALKHPLKEIRIHMALLLAEPQELKTIPILIDALHGNDNDIRKSAIAALVKVGPNAVPELSRVLHDTDTIARCAAIETLGEIRNTTVVPNLLKALQDPNEDVRVATINALGTIKDSRAVQDLLEVLGNVKNEPIVRYTAIFALGSIRDAKAVPDLSRYLLNDDDEDIRTWAAHALGEIRSSAGLPALIKALRDSNHLVRLSATGALGKIGDTSATSALAEGLTDSDPVVVDRTLGALRRFNTPEALAAIENWRNSQKNDG